MTNVIATRHAYGEILAEVGAINSKIVALDADVSSCTMSYMFGEKFPERFFNMGIAEANMVCAAAGMSTTGLIPFVHSFAMFTAGRTFEQIRNSVAYPRLNVKIVGTHAGMSVGEDGATHQCIEDLGIMRSIPGMTVICPCDGNETAQAVHAILNYDGPVYFRLGRKVVETVTTQSDYHFQIGKSVLMKDGNDATVIATGMMVQIALKAAEMLKQENINVRVLNMHTIKPIDEDAIKKAVTETGAIVTAEEHNVLCGLGSAVSEVVASKFPAPVLKVGVEDVFGKSGSAECLLEKYKLTKEHIVSKVKTALSMKKCGRRVP